MLVTLDNLATYLKRTLADDFCISFYKGYLKEPEQKLSSIAPPKPLMEDTVSVILRKPAPEPYYGVNIFHKNDSEYLIHYRSYFYYARESAIDGYKTEEQLNLYSQIDKVETVSKYDDTDLLAKVLRHCHWEYKDENKR